MRPRSCLLPIEPTQCLCEFHLYWCPHRTGVTDPIGTNKAKGYARLVERCEYDMYDMGQSGGVATPRFERASLDEEHRIGHTPTVCPPPEASLDEHAGGDTGQKCSPVPNNTYMHDSLIRGFELAHIIAIDKLARSIAEGLSRPSPR